MLSPLARGREAGGRPGNRTGARDDARDGDRDGDRDGVFLVEIERFQGPMDLLLHLIRQQDLDIFDIPIARITDQFLTAVKGIQASDLDSAGEFLEMAATLIRIKAQLLLPRPESDEDEDPRAELVRRLLEYEQVREITHHMENAEAERSRRFSKGFVAPRPRAPVEETPLETTWDEVFHAALEVTLPDLANRDHRVTPRTVSMDEKVLLILTRLREGGGGQGEGGERRVEFRALVAPFQERMHSVMTFLAGLELSRRRRIHLRQSAPFHDLWLYWREREPGDEADPASDTLGGTPDHPPHDRPDDPPDDPLGGRGE
jgi:segregation and condensation protein A